jgi:endonuclease/exonuclease/phosphatase (EEP) superfamily protein YafD
MRVARILLWSLIAWLALLALMPMAAPLGWLAQLLTHFRGLAAATALVLAIGTGVAWLRRARPRGRPWATLAALALLAVHLPGIIHRGPPPATGATELRLYLHNLFFIPRDPAAELAQVAAADADVAVFVEAATGWAPLLDGLRATHPHQHHDQLVDGHYAIAIASRRPFTVTVQPLLRSRSPMLVIDLAGAQPLRLLVVHPPPPLMAGPTIAQHALFTELVRRCAGATRTVVVGDFNCTPYAPAFQAMLRDSGLSDTAPGPVHWPTWGPSPSRLLPPLLPIDHVLTTPDLGAASHQVLGRAGSDHAALSVVIAGR